MSRVVVIVEGQTEVEFVSSVLVPELSRREVYLFPRLIGKPGHKGGIRPYQSAKADILACLKCEREAFCTTMFDFYGMPENWPGRPEAKGKPAMSIPPIVEAAMRNDIALALGDSYDPRRFIPYIQMYEFEALLFSDIEKLGYCYPGQAEAIGRLAEVAAKFPTPEMINDDPETAPSKRIVKEIARYQKIVAGSMTALEITLAKLREKCKHFDSWVSQLENLGLPAPRG
ncbi:MAG: DUF4276 family protein [Planctomycetota bacterium]